MSIDRLSQRFEFAGDVIAVNPAPPGEPFWNLGVTDFQSQPFINNSKFEKRLHSFQASTSETPDLLSGAPYYAEDLHPANLLLPSLQVAAQPQYTLYDVNAYPAVTELNTGDLDELFNYYRRLYPNLGDMLPAFGGYSGAGGQTSYHELTQPFALYNWELCFHAPMQLVERLLKSQQFDQALEMCQNVFNPLAPGSDEKRFWQFPPFKDVDARNTLETLFLSLKPNQPDLDITEWRDEAFRPHVIARQRPSAYMKWVAMTYIEILIEYGEYYMRQNTLETVPLAIQCFVFASHLFGPRGQKIPKRGTIKAETYNSLLNKWDAFGNAMVELELAFPFSNQIQTTMGSSNGVVGFANIFGFESSLYFCIPDNPQLMALRDRIDDRLYKLRHCQDIDGVFRKLPLFEPPIDPGLLVEAVAQGLSISSVLNDLNSPMPNYRFYYLLQKALELCSELKSLGNTFISVKEKGDAEALSRLRATHETSIQNLVMEVKKQQLDEANKSLDALEQNRKVPSYRLRYYLQLIGEDLSKIPGEDTDYNEVANQIEQPVDESGLKLIHYEKEEMDKASNAADVRIGIGATETLASIFHALPTISSDGKPLGIGVGASWGFPNLANAISSVARGLGIIADQLSYQSTSAGRKGGFLRQLQDRVQQANIAGYEVKNIDKQILTQKIRIDIASQEITNQQKQIDNAQEVEEFLRNKYTNQELYTWMEDSIRTLYHEAYNLSYDLAKKAEKVFRFERGLSDSNFIQFGYWDTAHDGLLSGERLYIGLKQLEAAYMEKRGHDYEISRTISLRQVNPLALLQLRETGQCEFALPEVLFDMDHPGHYMRRIKSVALTVPCVVGPYTSLNCTLRLLEHTFRTSPLTKPSYAPEPEADEPDPRFSTVNVPIASIAVSSGQNDSGVFDLNFKDERYLPFEGAGVISRWRLELPSAFQQFDYNTITDVLLHLRYTSLEGGAKLAEEASKAASAYLASTEDLSKTDGLFAVFDLKHDFPTEWSRFISPPAEGTDHKLPLNNLADRLPFFTRGRTITPSNVYLLAPASIKASLGYTGEEDPNDGEPFGEPKDIGKLKSFAINEVDEHVEMAKWQLTVQDPNKDLSGLWLVVRYTLTHKS
jgi:hypothetical protein